MFDDDPALALFDHRLGGGLRGKEDACHIGVLEALELFSGMSVAVMMPALQTMSIHPAPRSPDQHADLPAGAGS